MAAAYPDQGAGNAPEPLGLTLHYQGPTFINAVMHIVKLLQTWLIEIEGNMEVMVCLS